MNGAARPVFDAVRARARRDLWSIGAITVLVFALADLVERVHAFHNQSDELQIDELWFALFAATLGFAVFSFRRWRDLRDAYLQLENDQQRLVLSEKMASIGRLMAGIAHEMNTPLGAARTAATRVMTLSDEYRDSIGDPSVGEDDHREIAGEIRQAAELGGRGIARAVDYLTSLRHQTRMLEDEEKREFEVAEVVRETLLLLQHRLKAAGCRVRLETGDGKARLHGAPGRLSQVLINLLVNAADASAPQGGPIDLRLERDDGHLRLEVRDRGAGIDPRDLPRIFDPFFTTKASHEGTGLGLALTREIVTRGFGGTIEVESAPGRGSTFRVSLPALGEES